MRNFLIILCLALTLGLPAAYAANPIPLYKNPGCACCNAHARYLEAHGYEVTIHPVANLADIKKRFGVPAEVAGCHTILLDGYVVEGHVPVAAIERLLTEQPAVRGIAVPGMPPGSPGMPGEREGPLVVKSFGEDGIRLFGRF